MQTLIPLISAPEWSGINSQWTFKVRVCRMQDDGDCGVEAILNARDLLIHRALKNARGIGIDERLLWARTVD
jgi:hypothetical protein